MPIRKLKEFLEQQGIAYQSIVHPQTYTASRTAQAAHVKGKEMAKTVIVKVDGHMCMVALTANEHVDLERVRSMVGAQAVRLANEDEFSSLFPGCEVGAMPPFGNLYDMDVFVQKDLAEDQEIAFNAGTHTEVIRMAYSDFDRLVHPRVGEFAM